jgi:hypothetical protein
MSNLRELTNAELDLVGAGAMLKNLEPARPIGLGSNPVLVVLEVILRIVSGGEGKAPAPAKRY